MAQRIKDTEIFIIDKDGAKRRAVELECFNCGKIFLRKKSQVNKKPYYCSKKCTGEAQRKRDKFKCDYCGDVFEKTKSKGKTKTGLHFCCRECKDKAQRIENNILAPNNYKNGEYIYYRKRAFELYGKKCSHCGYDEFEEGLEVHHIDGNRKNNQNENLLVVCGTCHNLIERKVFKVVNRQLIRASGVNGNILPLQLETAR